MSVGSRTRTGSVVSLAKAQTGGSLAGDWWGPPDHPNAKVMAAKSGAILDAARNTFLRLGYDGTEMAWIAAAVGVSGMTLYRHSEGPTISFGR